RGAGGVVRRGHGVAVVGDGERTGRIDGEALRPLQVRVGVRGGGVAGGGQGGGLVEVGAGDGGARVGGGHVVRGCTSRGVGGGSGDGEVRQAAHRAGRGDGDAGRAGAAAVAPVDRGREVASHAVRVGVGERPDDAAELPPDDGRDGPRRDGQGRVGHARCDG